MIPRRRYRRLRPSPTGGHTSEHACGRDVVCPVPRILLPLISIGVPAPCGARCPAGRPRFRRRYAPMNTLAAATTSAPYLEYRGRLSPLATAAAVFVAPQAPISHGGTHQ